MWPCGALLLVCGVALFTFWFPLPLLVTVNLECHPAEMSLSLMQEGHSQVLQQNQNGKWKLPVGAHTLVFEAPSYETLTCNVSVAQNGEVYDDDRVPLKVVTLHEKRFDFKYQVSPSDAILVIDGKEYQDAQGLEKLRPGEHEVTFLHRQCKLQFPKTLTLFEDTAWEPIELHIEEIVGDSSLVQKRGILALFYAMPKTVREKYRPDVEQFFNLGDEVCEKNICGLYIDLVRQKFDEIMEPQRGEMKKFVLNPRSPEQTQAFAISATAENGNNADWAQLKAMAEFLVSQYPDQTDFIFWNAVCESQLNGYAKAEDIFGQAGDIPSEKILFQAECALLSNENERAVDLCSQVTENQSKDALVCINNGIILACLNEKERAINNFSAAIDYDETNVEAHVLRAVLWYLLGCSEKSIVDLNEAEKLNSDIPEVFRWRAKIRWDIFSRRENEQGTSSEKNLKLLDQIINDYRIVSTLTSETGHMTKMLQSGQDLSSGEQ